MKKDNNTIVKRYQKFENQGLDGIITVVPIIDSSTTTPKMEILPTKRQSSIQWERIYPLLIDHHAMISMDGEWTFPHSKVCRKGRVMPTRPKTACPTCRRIDCTNPDHKYSYKDKRAKRPITNQEIVRRKAAVDAYRFMWGDICPVCKQITGSWNPLTADHIIPVAQGGPEDGELQVMCRSCNSKKGGRNG